MNKKLRRGVLSVLAAGCVGLAAPGAFAQLVHVDDDFSAYSGTNIGDWQIGKGENPDNWAVWEQDPDGTPNNSIYIRNGNLYFDDWGLLRATPSNSEPLIFQVDIYDFMNEAETAPAAYAELRVVHGASWQATLFAVGVFNAPRTHYEFRMYPTQGWVPLSVPRSEGWHSFSIVIRGDSFDVFVNQDPYDENAQPDPNATNLPWEPHTSAGSTVATFESVHVGGASSTIDAAFLFDNVYLANDPAFAPAVQFLQHPTPSRAAREFGESITFTASASGLEPLTYQWTHDGEPLDESDPRITGSDTNSVTITDLDGPDSGLYRIVVTDANGASTTSNAAFLHAMIEHEVILNALDLPSTAFTGSWGVFSETAGWFGWMASTQTNDPGAEGLATFQPTITETGWYDVYTWYVPSFAGPGNNRGSEVPYDVYHAGGMDTVYMNQQHPSGPTAAQWFFVGTFEFNLGTDGMIEISNLRRGPSGADALGTLALADAVRWVPGDPPAPPGIARLQALGRNIDGLFQVRVLGEPSTSYVVSRSSTLAADSWEPFAVEETDGDGVLDVTDPESAEASRMFYRAEPD